MSVVLIGIYDILCKVNQKCYVGQAQDIYVRVGVHRYHLRRDDGMENCHLQRAWNKYGEASFEFRILEECTVDQLNDREAYWINQIPKQFRFNKRIIPCSNRGISLSIETKAKMSLSHKLALQDPVAKAAHAEATRRSWTSDRRAGMSASMRVVHCGADKTSHRYSGLIKKGASGTARRNAKQGVC